MTKVKAITTTKTSAIFLLVVLVTGTFALSLSSSLSSFIIGEAQAQTADYGYNDKNGYNSEYYPQDYGYDNKKYYPPNKDPPADIVVPRDFPTIQDAIEEANEGDVIKVLPGIYTEQIAISKSITILGSGAKSTIIETPPLPLDELNTGVLGAPYIVEVSNGAEVNMKGFTISGPDISSCGNTPFNGLIGVSVQEDATLKLDSSIIKDCTFVAVRVGAPPFLPNGPQVGHATITKTDITDYFFTGIAAFTSDSLLKITKSSIIAADTSNIDVGMAVENGAKAIIVGNIISGNKCKDPGCGPDLFNQQQSFGMVIASAPGSVISNNYVINNDVGIGIFGASGCCLIDHNKLVDNEFFGIVIADGEHTVSNTKIFGGKVGVAAIAFSANTVATLDGVKIVDAKTPIQALSSAGFTATVNVVSPYFLAPWLTIPPLIFFFF